MILFTFVSDPLSLPSHIHPNFNSLSLFAINLLLLVKLYHFKVRISPKRKKITKGGKMKYVVTLQVPSNYDSVVHFYGYFSRPCLPCTLAQLSFLFYYRLPRLLSIFVYSPPTLSLSLTLAIYIYIFLQIPLISQIHLISSSFFFTSYISLIAAFHLIPFFIHLPCALLRPHLLLSFHPIFLTRPFLSGR